MSEVAFKESLGRLAGQLQIYPDEGLQSFLFRSGLHNEFRQIGSLRNVLEIQGKTLPAKEVLERAAYVLGVSSHDLRRCGQWRSQEEGRNGWYNWFGTRLPETMVRTHFRRFLVGADAPDYTPATWMLVPASHCPLTFQKLYSACPSCGRELLWSNAHELDECPSCETQFSSLAPEVLEEDFRSQYAASFRIVDPVESVRAEALEKLPKPFCSWEAGDTFCSLLNFAGAVRGLERAQAGTEYPFAGSRRYTFLEARHVAAGYAILSDWESKIFDFCLEYHRTVGSPTYCRGLKHLEKYFKTPLATDDLWSVIEDQFSQAIKQSKIALYALKASPVPSKARGDLISLGEAREVFQIDDRTLQRLVPNGGSFHAKSDPTAGPVLFNEARLTKSVAAYKDSQTYAVAAQGLGIPSYAISALIVEGLLAPELDRDALLLANEEPLVCARSMEDLKKSIAGSNGRGGRSLVPLKELMTWVADPRAWAALTAALVGNELRAKVIDPDRKTPTFQRLGLPRQEFLDWLGQKKSVWSDPPHDSFAPATKSDAAYVLDTNSNAIRAAIIQGVLSNSEGDPTKIAVSSLVSLAASWVSTKVVAALLERSSREWFESFSLEGVTALPLADQSGTTFTTLFDRNEVITYCESRWPRRCPLRLI
ncbi:hypothetical protein GCM10011367_24230 [Marinicauda pacifica]|uniref:TniQ family protein n=1 Tax=Marinicauda pacifica TaxID=1133559 RepID=A0A4S2H977_9PROT|nr:hypothetical protein [Marinicauda pacifica]TGY92400.1 hypothetical protein E5162_12195 [Marinicauda pacifica]GGE48561.1 hypothetical protein GCM10011367_24230 [Marinicauda pacifica]